MTKSMLLCLALLASSAGCAYLEDRGNDLVDCFKFSASSGAGISAHVRVGPFGTHIGYWKGRSSGLEDKRSLNSWDEFAIGIPLSPLPLLMRHSLRFEKFLLLKTLFGGVERQKFDGNREKSCKYALLWLEPECSWSNFKYWKEYFWIEASFRCFVGVKGGFNILEFTDFILGWFGIDIGLDDTRNSHRW